MKKINAKQPLKNFEESFTANNYIGIFLISMAVLIHEFNLTRVLSVSLWYNFAFMIISIALLGFGISGVFLANFKIFQSRKNSLTTSVLSIVFGATVLISFYIMNLIPVDPFSLLSERIQLIYLPLYYILITIPFFFAGLIIALLITKFEKNIHTLYFFDLLGAGFACFVFIVFVPLVGSDGTIAIVAIIGFLSSVVFSYKKYRKIIFVSLALIFISIIVLYNKSTVLKINVSPNKKIVNLAELRPDLKILTEWNSFSKVDVVSDEDEPIDGYRLYIGIIDAGNANTNIPFVKSLPILRKPADASNLAFANKEYGTDSNRNVFIIGSAGGGEILVSLYHKAKKVVGVEINGILNNLISNKLSYWTGPLIKNNKSVELITNDARAELNKRDEKFDVIISAHTISASAVSSGAMSMVENYILTREAISEYIGKLTDSGVLYISRPETQLFKLITTLRVVDSEDFGSGVEKRNNISENSDYCNFKEKIIVFKRKPTSLELEEGKSFLAGVIYKKNGFSPEEVYNIKLEAIDLNLETLYFPQIEEESLPESDIGNLIENPDINEEILNIKNKYNLDITPATDNKPFFDNNIGFRGLNFDNIKEVLSQDKSAIFAIKDKPVAEVTIIILLVQIIIISCLFLIFPFVFQKKNDSEVLINKSSKNVKKYFIIYFSLLGLGYIMIQISMMQKFTLFLGQPVYTMLTVISTMLVGSGIGSRVSKNMPEKYIRYIFLLIVLCCLFIGLVVPNIFYGLVKTSLFLKVLFSIIIIFPISFFMGMPFPLGITKLGILDKSTIPICWAVNGFFSVIGTALIMLISMISGFKLIYVISAIIYSVAFLLFLKFSFNNEKELILK